jgi:MFS family permease
VPPGRTSRVAAELRTLPRQFWLLAAGTFVYLIGVEMCYPFETIYLRDVLGVSVTAIGLIVGVTLFATLPMQVVGGALCDRYGRRPILAVAIVGSMTLYIGLGVAHQLWIIVALIAFEAAFGWAQFITASNAMVADLTPLSRRAEAFSVSRVALNAGITLGPLAAAPLISRDPTFRLAFLAAGAVCGIFLVMVLALFRETRPVETKRLSVASAFGGYGRVVRDRRMLAFCLVALLPLFGFGQIWVTMPIMLGELHGVSAQQWALLMVVYGASMATLQYPVIRLFSKYDHMGLMSVSALFVGAGMGAAAFVPYPATYACVILISLGIVLLIPISSTVVSNLAPAELRGRYMGMWTLVYMGGYALGPLLGGWALARLGGRGAFAATGAVALLGAALFPLLRRSGTGRGRASGEGETPEAQRRELRGERPEQAL